MATYAIGDIQGGYSELRRLLDQCRFDPADDRLWLVGDLVNRGHESARVLRFVKGLGERAVAVLGNHDLSLLAISAGGIPARPGDTIQDVLEAPDREELLGWLRARPLVHLESGTLMVHAGLLPAWSPEQALALSREVETALQGGGFREFCARMYGNQPDRWDEGLRGFHRLRVIVNAMSRLRVCTLEGTMDFAYTGNLEHVPEGLIPWFDMPERASEGTTVVCGHWAALGLRLRDDLIALDTGCLWGGRLTAVRLEDRKVFQVACGQAAPQGRPPLPLR
ncbi:MAG TPA: symmetrical bis(5'-nucleosyl)-tetraphosphatase [Burkholderiales bacterium]|nr:symmetrical bis(5'-nucleosyl)-tetraphosphatase [Burkholderiales bacterium]